MGSFLLFRRIVLPQAARYALPGVGNVWQLVLKESALISVIGLVELMRQAQVGSGSTRQPFSFYLTAAALYLSITFVSGQAFRLAEARSMRGLRRACDAVRSRIPLADLRCFAGRYSARAQARGFSVAAGTVLAFGLALMRVSRRWWLDLPARFYIFAFRGTPLLVQIYIIYYGLSQFPELRHSFIWPFLRDAYWCAMTALALNTAAYSAEIMRGGLLSVPAGQIEAAKACGMGRVNCSGGSSSRRRYARCCQATAMK